MSLKSVSPFAVAAMLLASNAHAVILLSTDTNLDAPLTSGADLLDPTSTTGNVRIDFVGNDLVAPAPNSRSPYDTTAFQHTAVYHSVSAGATATFSFASPQTSFAFMWGSPDDYNTLNFYLLGVNVGSFTGDSVIPPGTAGLGFVDVVFGGSFDMVVFGSSNTDAFEFTNIYAAVPEPAAALLLGLGLIGLGRVRRA